MPDGTETDPLAMGVPAGTLVTLTNVVGLLVSVGSGTVARADLDVLFGPRPGICSGNHLYRRGFEIPNSFFTECRWAIVFAEANFDVDVYVHFNSMLLISSTSCPDLTRSKCLDARQHFGGSDRISAVPYLVYAHIKIQSYIRDSIRSTATAETTTMIG